MTRLSISEASRLMREGTLSPVELVTTVLEEIEHRDPELGAYVEVYAEEALRAARLAERRFRSGSARVLEGIPISVKDIFDIKGRRTHCGSPHAAYVADHTASAIARLQSAGAIILGKTHLHEYALGITGVNPWFGTPANPIDATRLPGGSSSGSAVSVAAGMALAAIGTDTGGSVRVPAALCGIVGFKPTFGVVSLHGVFPLSWSFDHVGFLTRTVGDAVALLEAARGVDSQDTDSVARPLASPREVTAVLLFRDVLEAAVPAVKELVRAGVAALGVMVREVDLPFREFVPAAFSTIQLAEAALVHRERLREAPETLGADVRRLLLLGAATMAADYVQAQRVRQAFFDEMLALLDETPCAVLPTTLVPAPMVDDEEVETGLGRLPTREALIMATRPFNMAGLPVCSVPIGTVDGLPVGLQVVGRPFEDLTVANLAQHIHDSMR